MKIKSLVLALSTVASLAAPALAQSPADQRRWEAAQQRYQAETRIYERERDRYYRFAGRGGGYYQDNRGYGAPSGNYPPPGQGGYQSGYQSGYSGGYDDDRYSTDYDASRYYRNDSRYQERRLGANDEVYRGSDGRYYCKRSDGTTGLIVGAAAGGILGNVLDGGRHRTGGTLVGGALGALLGRSVDQNSDIRCR